MTNEIINIENVAFSYKKNQPLLESINLKMEYNRIYGLLGKNGEGKSTLLKLISGLSFPQSGQINVMGFNPQKRNPAFLQEVFFLTEELPQIHLSAADYEKVYAPFYPKFSSELFNKLLLEFEIDSRSKTQNTMSHGQKKKVMIAFGLATQTKLLLMDEPTNGLDIPSKAQFRKIVASIINEENCMIISTHQVRDLDNLIDSVTIMDNHKITFNQTLGAIEEKLLFKVSDRNNPDQQAIYSEDTLRGLYQICKNTTGESSKVDIELLFNAIVCERDKVYSQFN